MRGLPRPICNAWRLAGLSAVVDPERFQGFHEPPFQQKLTTSSQNCSATKVLQQKLCKLASQLSRKILSMHALGMPSFVGFPLAKTSMVFIVVFYKIKEVEDLWHGVHKGFKGK